jgi:hypothetical protein
VGAEDDDLLLRTDMGIRVTRVGVETPFEDRAWNVDRAGDDPLLPSLVLGAKVDEGCSALERCQYFCRFEARTDPTLRVGKKLSGCSA